MLRSVSGRRQQQKSKRRKPKGGKAAEGGDENTADDSDREIAGEDCTQVTAGARSPEPATAGVDQALSAPNDAPDDGSDTSEGDSVYVGDVDPDVLIAMGLPTSFAATRPARKSKRRQQRQLDAAPHEIGAGGPLPWIAIESGDENGHGHDSGGTADWYTGAEHQDSRWLRYWASWTDHVTWEFWNQRAAAGVVETSGSASDEAWHAFFAEQYRAYFDFFWAELNCHDGRAPVSPAELIECCERWGFAMPTDLGDSAQYCGARIRVYDDTEGNTSGAERRGTARAERRGLAEVDGEAADGSVPEPVLPFVETEAALEPVPVTLATESAEVDPSISDGAVDVAATGDGEGAELDAGPVGPRSCHPKYWAQRYRFFSRFDQGIEMDYESCKLKCLRSLARLTRLLRLARQ